MSIKIKNVIRWDIIDEEYFGEKFSNYISNSRLRLLNISEGGSYDVFCNPSKGVDKDSFILGTAIHRMLLESGTYYLSEFTAPGKTVVAIFDTVYDYMVNSKMSLEEAINTSVLHHKYYGGNPGEKRLSTLMEEGLPYLDFLNNKTKDPYEIVLPTGMKKIVEEVVELLKVDKHFNKMIRPNEKGIIETYYETAFTCDIDTEEKTYGFKAKIDLWTLDYINKKVYLNDLKTTSQNLDTFMGSKEMVVKVDPENMFPDFTSSFKSGSFQNYHYYRQMYIYAAILKAYLIQENIIDETWQMEVNMIVIQTTYKVRCLVFPVNEEWLSMGELEINYLFSILDEKQFTTFQKYDYNNEFDLQIDNIDKLNDDDLIKSILNDGG